MYFDLTVIVIEIGEWTAIQKLLSHTHVLSPPLFLTQDLLADGCVVVRVTAVTGVCRVLSLYLDLIPFPVMKQLLGKLVQDLVWDAAAIGVRVAVVQVINWALTS